MIKNIFYLFIIFVVSYLVSIFNAPDLAKKIETTLGITGFNEYVLNFKSTYDNVVTNVPTREELNNAYNEIHSGAIEFKDNFKEGMDLTKDKIDDLRVTLSGAEDTINKVVDGIEDAKEFIETNSGKIDEVRNTIEKVSEISEVISNTGVTN